MNRRLVRSQALPRRSGPLMTGEVLAALKRLTTNPAETTTE